jgi:hypothetical protein
MVIADLLPANTFIGVSLILHQEGGFLFGIRPSKWIDGQEILEITGIGGRLEASDPSLAAGLQREASEEIAARVEIIPCPRTLVVNDPDHLSWVVLEGEERPAALVFRNHPTPPHQPWHATRQGNGCIAVFFGRLLAPAIPSAEIPHLIWLKPEQILQVAQRDLAIGDLQAAGATLCSREAQEPDGKALARLTDSQEALALALGNQAPAFYRSLLDLIPQPKELNDESHPSASKS